MQNIDNPEIIEVLISDDGQTLWVNTEYECVLRVNGIRKLFLNDNRKKSSLVVLDPPGKAS